MQIQSRDSKRVVLLFLTRELGRVTITFRPNPDPMNRGNVTETRQFSPYVYRELKYTIFVIASLKRVYNTTFGLDKFHPNVVTEIVILCYIEI